MTTTISDAEKKIEIFRTMAHAWYEQDWHTCANHVIEFDGDEIARFRDYYDRSQLARAAGHNQTVN